MTVINPATEEVIARVPDASPENLDAAIAAARNAFPAWATTSIAERKAKLLELARAIMANIEELKRLLTAEQGKPLGDSEFEIGGAAWWLSATAELDLPVTVTEDSPERLSLDLRDVCGLVLHAVVQA